MESLLQNIDPNEPGEWPIWLKVVAAIGLCVAMIAAGYYFIIKDKQAELELLEQKETELKQSFEYKQSKAANLDAYKQQMDEIRTNFSSMLEQLPRKTEVADLLVDITRTGLNNGLEFDLFQPESERPRDFYAELPIAIKVTGSYHQIGQFVGGVAALPRIVTMHNLSIRRAGDSEANVTMDITAKTYRYFDEEQE
jgi:type IV pilus assembly protein PilO